MKKIMIGSFIAVALLASNVCAVSAATNDGVASKVGISTTPNSHNDSTFKMKKNGKTVEVIVTSEAKGTVSEALIQNILDSSSDKAYRVTIGGITSSSPSSQGTTNPTAWYDYSSITATTVGYPNKGGSWGLPFVICTTAEGQSYTFSSKYTHTDSYQISGTYNASALGSLTSQLSTSTAYEVSVGATYSAPPEDPNYRVTRYYKASIVYDVYPFSWEKYGVPSQDLLESGSGYYKAPTYYANWSEDVKF